VQIVESASEVLEGCSSETVGADIVVHLLIKGLINIEQELAKAEKKVNAAKNGIERLKKVVAKPETPEEIKAKSTDEIKVLEAEMAALSLSIEQFSKMR
jgi:valyl-tRNA synthetase